MATNNKANFKNKFEIRNPTYSYASTNIIEKALIYYRKAVKQVSKTLAEEVAGLWKDRVEIERVLQQTNPQHQHRQNHKHTTQRNNL